MNISNPIKVTAFFALAWAFVVSTPSTAFAGNGEKSNSSFARIDFDEDDVHSPTPFFRMVSDGLSVAPTVCLPASGNDHPFGGVWDYWKLDDPDVSLDCNYDLRGGDCSSPRDGLKFSTSYRRSVRINWKGALVSPGPDWAKHLDPPADPEAPNLDVQIYDPNINPTMQIDPDPTIDHLHVWLSQGDVFKPGTTRHEWGFSIFVSGGGRDWHLEYHEPVYIYQDPDNPDDPQWAWVTTYGPDMNSSTDDAGLCDLTHVRKGKGDDIIGTYDIPFSFIVRRGIQP